MKVAETLSKDGHYTYADLLTWNDDVRYELVDGVAYAMTSPTTSHQRVLRDLGFLLYTYLRGRSCELFVAPSDVRLTFENNDDTVFQPDLYVVCDKSKLHERGCLGAPDLVIEILSPSTARFDMIVKYQKYQEVGVREYWIVDPEGKTVDVFILENSLFVRREYGSSDIITSHLLDGCEVNLAEVFGN